MEPDESAYFSGEKLRGDDYTIEQIREWFELEKEGYANLRNSYADRFTFQWHDFYLRHGWNKLGRQKLGDLLAVGAADGQEIETVATRFDHITILEPSDQFVTEEVAGVPVRYVKPSIDGTMPFADKSFDVISCFGTLHHIPNVSKVISEFARVLRGGGHAIIREPIVSMNDWRIPRPGLTKNERGIPIRLMRSLLRSAGLQIIYEKRFGCPIATVLARILRSARQSRLIRSVDTLASGLFAWNNTYFTTNPFLKIRTTNAIWVVRKL